MGVVWCHMSHFSVYSGMWESARGSMGNVILPPNFMWQKLWKKLNFKHASKTFLLKDRLSSKRFFFKLFTFFACQFLKAVPLSVPLQQPTTHFLGRFKSFPLPFLIESYAFGLSFHIKKTSVNMNQAQASDQFLATNKLATNKAICLKTKKRNKSKMYF